MKNHSYLSCFLHRRLHGLAQEQPKEESKKEPKKEIEELKLKLNEDGSHYIKATFIDQVWFRLCRLQSWNYRVRKPHFEWIRYWSAQNTFSDIWTVD